MATAKVESAGGWSKPLKVRYQYKLPELMSAIRKYTPEGEHSHDQISGSYSKAGFPRTGGRLKRAIGTLGNYSAPKGKNSVKIVIDLPYARIIDVGGKVGAARNRRMTWRQDGRDVSELYRRGYNIRGAHFITKGATDWVNDGSHGGGQGIKASWV